MDDVSIIFAKLKAIQSALDTPFIFNGRKYFPYETHEYFPQYNALITELQKHFPDLYGSFKERRLKFNSNGGDIFFEFFETLKIDLKRIFTIKQEYEIATNTPTESKESAFLFLDNLFNEFHNVALRLRNRYGKRKPLLIKDEYDVQDLLHALLRLHFKDIRPEDYTPSNSGSNSRIDFILKKEKIGIEVKMTNKNLKDKTTGEQLLTDIGRYKEHPDCSCLFIFIYDRGDFIINKQGLKRDLEEQSTDEFPIKVYINPN